MNRPEDPGQGGQYNPDERPPAQPSQDPWGQTRAWSEAGESQYQPTQQPYPDSPSTDPQAPHPQQGPTSYDPTAGYNTDPGGYQQPPAGGYGYDQPAATSSFGQQPPASGGYGPPGGYGGYQPPTGGQPGGPGKPKWPWIAGIIAALVLLAIIIGGVVWALGGDDDTTAPADSSTTTTAPTTDDSYSVPTVPSTIPPDVSSLLPPDISDLPSLPQPSDLFPSLPDLPSDWRDFLPPDLRSLLPTP